MAEQAAPSTGAPLAAAIFTLAAGSDVRTLADLLDAADRRELQRATICLAGAIVGMVTTVAHREGVEVAAALEEAAHRFGLIAAQLDGDR
jgi:hypothetical protein